jgi:biotin carboxyl carrier protein
VKYQVTVAGQSFQIEVDHKHLVRVNGHPLYVELEQVGGLPVYSLALGDKGHLVFVEEGYVSSQKLGGGVCADGEATCTHLNLPRFVEGIQGYEQYRVEVQGQVYSVEVASQRPPVATQQLECSGDAADCLALAAPLAGHLVSLLVAAGDRVEAGQAVAIVESMKMQMKIRAPQPGIVEVVHGPSQRNVDQGEELVRLRTEPQAPPSPRTS